MAPEMLTRKGWSLHDAAWLWCDRLPGKLSREDRTHLREVMDEIRAIHAALVAEAHAGRLSLRGRSSEDDAGRMPDRFAFIDAAHHERAVLTWRNRQAAQALGCDDCLPDGTGLWFRQAYAGFAERRGERPNFLFNPEHFGGMTETDPWRT